MSTDVLTTQPVDFFLKQGPIPLRTKGSYDTDFKPEMPYFPEESIFQKKMVQPTMSSTGLQTSIPTFYDRRINYTTRTIEDLYFNAKYQFRLPATVPKSAKSVVSKPTFRPCKVSFKQNTFFISNPAPCSVGEKEAYSKLD